jgi:hypothetical protein
MYPFPHLSCFSDSLQSRFVKSLLPNCTVFPTARFSQLHGFLNCTTFSTALFSQLRCSLNCVVFSTARLSAKMQKAAQTNDGLGGL